MPRHRLEADAGNLDIALAMRGSFRGSSTTAANRLADANGLILFGVGPNRRLTVRNATTMNDPRKGIESARKAAALCAWENEGGAPDRECRNYQYGRRVEADRTWTIYHVFTGVPAIAKGLTMTGLSRTDATSRMLFLNLGNAAHGGERKYLARPQADASTTAVTQP
jgi:hypothetical protein